MDYKDKMLENVNSINFIVRLECKSIWKDMYKLPKMKLIKGISLNENEKLSLKIKANFFFSPWETLLEL